MNNIFNSVKALKSGEDCKKFSKSVSYETLVGGTATIGRECVKNQRLSEGSADKLLIAVGTLTSLLRNSAKVEKLLRHVITRRTSVRRGYLIEQSTHENKESLFASVTCFMRLPRRIQRMLLVMTIPASCREAHKRRFIFNLIRRSLEKFFKKNFRDDSYCFGFAKVLALALVFNLATISESSADDENRCKTVHGKYSECIERLTDENGKNSCGDNCTFKVVEENGKQVLHVYKVDISKPATIREGAFSPKYYEGKQVLDANGNPLSLNNIMLDNDFEYAPYDAFAGSGAEISSASGKFVFNNGQLYFGLLATLNGDVVFNNSVEQAVENTRINGDVIISDNVTDITKFSFEHSEINGNIVIPDTIQAIGLHAFRNLSITGQIYCASGVEACYNMIKTGCHKNSSCLTSLENLLNSKKFSDYPDGCLSMGAKARCTKCKSASFKLEDDGWCLRKIYTPAEAAEVLKDDNNTVTITFRK